MIYDFQSKHESMIKFLVHMHGKNRRINAMIFLIATPITLLFLNMYLNHKSSGIIAVCKRQRGRGG